MFGLQVVSEGVYIKEIKKGHTAVVSLLNGCGKRPSFTSDVRPDIRKKGVQQRMKMPMITPIGGQVYVTGLTHTQYLLVRVIAR